MHPSEDPSAELGEVIDRVCGRGGVVIMPAFAIGRAEPLLLHLTRLRERGVIPEYPVFLNSPMAVDASEIYKRYPQEHRVSAEEFERMYSMAHVRVPDFGETVNVSGRPAAIVP
jgi:Predicted metal-dependent RNase, consists of a metallo-beta-lactamase domain and an RNA-binding KH domain